MNESLFLSYLQVCDAAGTEHHRPGGTTQLVSSDVHRGRYRGQVTQDIPAGREATNVRHK